LREFSGANKRKGHLNGGLSRHTGAPGEIRTPYPLVRSQLICAFAVGAPWTNLDQNGQ